VKAMINELWGEYLKATRQLPQPYVHSRRRKWGTTGLVLGYAKKRTERDMPQHQPHNYRRVTDPAPINSPSMWAIGIGFLVALAVVLFVYNGTDWSPKSGENPPPQNTVTGAGQK
jgi:hypothetical protein